MHSKLATTARQPDMLETACPECGAAWSGDLSCEAGFHQLLFWETEDPALGAVHHLMVLCYHLQHPTRMSRQGLASQMKLLEEFVEHDVSPAQARRNARRRAASDRRAWKVTARPGDVGSYDRPMHWPMTAVDVVAAGKEHYLASVRRWAEQTHRYISGAADQ